ncbi:unnamed protein product [Caenorhabditis nigoni]
MPNLVGEMVVTELEYQEIFLLSICSRRASFLVKKARIKVPRLALQFGERHGYDELQIGVVINNIWLHVTSLLHVHKLEFEEKFTVKLGLDYEADTIFQLWRKNNGTCTHRMKCANEPIATQKAFQDYINSIFDCSDTNQLILSMKYEGSLPSIPNVKEIEINNKNVDSKLLKNVLTTYSEHQSLYVRSRIVGELPKDSPVFQVQDIIVGCPCGPDYFLNFNGRNMWLEHATLTEQDLNQLLHRWISNDAYHNLEASIIFTDSEQKLNKDLIRQAIEFEEYVPSDPEKIEADFIIDRPYIGSRPDKYILDEGFIEIKRTTDGKRGFL